MLIEWTDPQRSPRKQLMRKKPQFVPLLNVEGMFDNTCHETIKRILEKKEVNSVTFRWMCNLLSTRKSKTKVA